MGEEGLKLGASSSRVETAPARTRRGGRGSHRKKPWKEKKNKHQREGGIPPFSRDRQGSSMIAAKKLHNWIRLGGGGPNETDLRRERDRHVVHRTPARRKRAAGIQLRTDLYSGGREWVRANKFRKGEKQHGQTPSKNLSLGGKGGPRGGRPGSRLLHFYLDVHAPPARKERSKWSVLLRGEKSLRKPTDIALIKTNVQGGGGWG